MVPRLLPVAAFLALSLAFFAGLSCRHPAAPAAIDPALASSVPPGTALLGGIDLDRLRSAPLYAQLPVAALLQAQALHGASQILLAVSPASTGLDVLVLARGNFAAPPAGATLLEPGLAAVGNPDFIRAAAAQRRTGRSGAPDLVARAASIAAENQVWAVARGGIALPLGGNAANLNRILRATEWTTLAARVDSGIHLQAAGACSTAEGARQLEESVRALLSLAAVSLAREPDLAALVRAVGVSRENLAVRATLDVPPAQAAKLLDRFGPFPPPR
jgi:hypothetical protein